MGSPKTPSKKKLYGLWVEAPRAIPGYLAPDGSITPHMAMAYRFRDRHLARQHAANVKKENPQLKLAMTFTVVSLPSAPC